LKPRNTIVGDHAEAKEDGVGEALPAGHAIQTKPPFPLFQEVLRPPSLVVPFQDLEGAFLLQGPVAGQGHAWLFPVRLRDVPNRLLHRPILVGGDGPADSIRL